MTVPLPDDNTCRTITDAPAYVITADGEVWSRPRVVAGKNGSTRTLQARMLQPDNAGRVSLRVDGATARVSVGQMFARYWPEVHYEKHQFLCRGGHPLIGANVAVWGCGNRVCAVCWPDWTPPAKSQKAVRQRPGRPRVMDVEKPTDDEIAALVALGHGFQIESGFTDGEYPRVAVMPVGLVDLLCSVEGTPWGAGDTTPGVLSPTVGTGTKDDATSAEFIPANLTIVERSYLWAKRMGY